MANLKDVIYLSNEDYDTLVSTGTVTIDGDVLTYDENNVYITPEVTASSSQDGLMSAADKVKLDGIEAEMANYLPLTGGTLSLANADSLKIKRTSSGSGAFITYYNNNQNTNYWFAGMDTSNTFKFQYSDGGVKAQIDPSGVTTLFTNSDYGLVIKRLDATAGAYTTYYNNNQSTNYWRVGMRNDGPFSFAYNGNVMASISTSGSIYENGTALSSKYLGISAKAADSSKLNGQEASYYLNYNNLTNKPTIPTTYVSTVNGASGAITNVAKTNIANTFIGNNTFSGAFSATDGATISADSGDVIFDVSPSGIDLNSRYGVNIYASERGYISAYEPIQYQSGVALSSGSDLVPKSYVDNKTYTTSIATSSGMNQLTLAFGTKYALTAGGTSYVFTMPSNPNTNQTVKAGSTTFGANAAVAIAAGTRITVTPNATNNTITIATTATADSAITNTQIDTLF